MGWFDVAKDVTQMATGPVGKLWGAAETAYHGGASAWDYATGDSEGGKEHLEQFGWGAVGLIPGVGDAIGVAQLGKDTGDAIGVSPSPSDKPAPEVDKPSGGGEIGAGWGTIAALPFGPLGWAAGALLGGHLGASVDQIQSTDDLEEGTYLPSTIESLAVNSMMNPTNAKPGEPICKPGKSDVPSPFDYYAD